ncbi:hypothetical protein [Allorhodopirellula solitaria]|uniref:hypothetical protein n=1 Tax=Allorhodopirellula solitaria TaxID=2527987 RepID=UPI0011B7250B|nr:hypothetical protein [Allorhodopirellula solitaria]
MGGLTVAWHPCLLAATRRTPSWHRSDESPPPIRVPVADPANAETADPAESGEPAESAASAETGKSTADNASTAQTLRRLLIIPEVCISTLTGDLRDSVDRDAVSREELLPPEDPGYESACEVRVRVSSRPDALEKLAAVVPELSGARDGAAEGSLDVQDFFALGYMWWQTQILTRRLRYTSNLDQIYFESRLVAAADHFLAGEITAATDALHDCFDALAEERDHYFSSDPAIIDLTLLTPGTLQRWLDARTRPTSSDPAEVRAARQTGLATPENILVDESVATAILQGDADRREQFRASLKRSEQELSQEAGDPQPDAVGWCGGGPASDFSMDAHSIATGEERLAEAIRTVRESGSAPLTVYARLGGGVAGEWISSIAAAGFDGIVPLDFLGGRGFDDESKVLLGEGDYEIEALTAKPIDADDETAFLNLAAQLGEAIDRGEIATALLVHWPGGGCDSFHDVRRAASWSLCLGKFWRIDDYFTDGERPFHHGTAPGATPAAMQTVGDLYERRTQSAIDLQTQRDANLRGFAALLDPAQFLPPASDPATSPEIADDAAGLPQRIAASLGYAVDTAAIGSNAAAANVLLLHPTHPAARLGLPIAGKVTAKSGSIFHAETADAVTRVIADVPAWGFALVGTAATKQAGSDANALSPLQKAMRWFSGGPGKMLDDNQFSNEFMEVTIDRVHGGVDAVHSGPGRGNRFSLRLMLSPQSSISAESKTDATATPWLTVCTRFETIENTQHRAVLELTGEFQPNPDTPPGEAELTGSGAAKPTKWQVQYSLQRGSRRLLYRIRVDAASDAETQVAEAWRSSPVLRMAMAESSPVVRSISREKLARTSARSFSSSLGFVIDEETRSTLIACPGASVHRRPGDRFFDTIVAAESLGSDGWSSWQSYCLGFDIRQPVGSAKSFAQGDQLCSVPVKMSGTSAAAATPQRGWLIHPSPASLEVQVVSVGRATRDDDQPDCMAIHLRVIQTAGRSVSASLRFCRDVHSAYEISPLSRPLESNPSPGVLSLSRLTEISNPESISAQGDRISWSQRSHGIVHLIVLFPLGEPT